MTQNNIARSFDDFRKAIEEHHNSEPFEIVCTNGSDGPKSERTPQSYTIKIKVWELPLSTWLNCLENGLTSFGKDKVASAHNSCKNSDGTKIANPSDKQRLARVKTLAKDFQTACFAGTLRMRGAKVRMTLEVSETIGFMATSSKGKWKIDQRKVRTEADLRAWHKNVYKKAKGPATFEQIWGKGCANAKVVREQRAAVAGFEV